MNFIIKASEYIIRYAPSRSRLEKYLIKKGYIGDIPLFLSEIGYDESLMAEMWFSTFMASGKSIREIGNKLTQKEFPKSLREEKIEKYRESLESWESQKSIIEMKRDTLQKRGKSKRMLLNLLTSNYPYFRDEIRELVESTSDLENLEREGRKYLEKYDMSTPYGKQKFFQALERKGYSYGDVKDFLRKKDSEDESP